MIVKVLLQDKDGSQFTMLFGDSYKKWQNQFSEFMYRYYTPRGEGWRYENVKGRVHAAWKSNSAWKSFGGLKWCDEESFQQELNREDRQADEPDNMHPRIYADMKFKPYPLGTLTKALKKY